MKKRSLCQIGTMFLLGMSWRIFQNAFLVIGAMGMFLYILWQGCYYPKRKGWRAFVIGSAILFFCIGAVRGQWSSEREALLDRFLLEGDTVSFQGELYKKEIKSDILVYYLRDAYLQKDREQIFCPSIILYPDSDEDSIGTIFIGKARVLSFKEARNEGNFDEKTYARSLGYGTKLISPKIEKRILPCESIRWEIAIFREYMTNSLKEIYATWLPGEEGGLLATMLLGEKSLLEPEAKKLFQVVGLAHLLAISGLHISLVGNYIYRCLRRMGIGFGIAGGMAGILVYEYAKMCGMGVSVLRALLMYCIMLLSQGLGEAYDSLTALMAASLVMTWLQPMNLKNTGFLFSYMAVLGVVTIGKEMSKAKGIWSKLGMAVGIQLFTLPFVARFYYEIPLYSVFLNLLILPLMGVLLGMGLSGGMIGFALQNMGVTSAWVKILLVGIPMKICHGILYLCEFLSDVVSKLPGNMQIIGCPRLWRVFVYLMILFFSCYKVQKKGQRFFLVLIALLILIGPEKNQFEIDMLDVGQGDGILITTEEGERYFIDGGSTDVKAVGTYRILPHLKYRGIRHIDYWFVSHPDEDHISGILECMEEGYKIEHLVFAKGVVKNENFAKLQEAAKRNDIPIYYMKQGDNCGTKSVKFTCVYAGKENSSSTQSNEDPNANCLALLIEKEDFKALFTGDLAIEQEAMLPLSKIGKVTLFKAGHHGSKGSNDSQLLKRIHPDVVLISCGQKNRYGHPHDETLQRFGEIASQVYRTDVQGEIKISIKQGNRKVTCFFGQ